MKLSIITINLNNRDGLQKTIDSVVTQTFKDFEWIVIDGGSTDGSKELIEQYADHFAYWVSEPDKGIYNAMNKGIKVAKGEYLQFLNSGDWLWENDTLNKVFSSTPNEDILYGNWEQKDGILFSAPHKLDAIYFFQSTLSHQAVFIKKSLFLYELYDETLKVASDWKHLLSSIVIENHSYKALNITVIGEQDGESYDSNICSLERNEILKKMFPPMIHDSLEHLVSIKNNSMYPYYEYIDQHPALRKWVRRIVRLNKMLHHS